MQPGEDEATTGTAEPPLHSRLRYYARRARQLADAGYNGFNDARLRVNQHAVGWKPGDANPARVAVYYPDAAVKIYQVQQWLPVLERVHAEQPVVLVTRSQDSHEALAAMTWLPRVCLPKRAHLNEMYAASDIALALYVNNGFRNFQSLASPRMLHVHINHGESDKLSMVSNQAKAYDRVLIAGEAARRRHQAMLMEFDDQRLIAIGRPQLDLLPPSALPPSKRRTVLYAPTWQGEREQQNYSSVDTFGPALVQALLDVPNVRVVYKPHPRTVTSTEGKVSDAHATIQAQIDAAARAHPEAGHVCLVDVDILAVLPAADMFVGDVSSVTLDYLYLRADNPVLLCDRHNDRRRLLVASPAAVATDVITEQNVAKTTALVTRRLGGDDPHQRERARVRELYFGSQRPGQSVDRFLDVLHELVQLRDQQVSRLRPRLTLSSVESADDAEDAEPPAAATRTDTVAPGAVELPNQETSR